MSQRMILYYNVNLFTYKNKKENKHLGGKLICLQVKI